MGVQIFIIGAISNLKRGWHITLKEGWRLNNSHTYSNYICFTKVGSRSRQTIEAAAKGRKYILTCPSSKSDAVTYIHLTFYNQVISGKTMRISLCVVLDIGFERNKNFRAPNAITDIKDC